MPLDSINMCARRRALLEQLLILARAARPIQQGCRILAVLEQVDVHLGLDDPE